MGTFKKILLNIAALAAAAFCFSVAFLVIYYVISFIARIPLLAAILYWPSDVGIAIHTLPLIAGISAGIFVSSAICGNAKLVAVVLIALNALSLLSLLSQSALGLGALTELGTGLVGGFIAWEAN